MKKKSSVEFFAFTIIMAEWKSCKIVDLKATDIRFPTSLHKDGSDAMVSLFTCSEISRQFYRIGDARINSLTPSISL